MNQIHYINGKVVKPPFNYQETEIEIVFEEDSEQRNSTVTRFDWRNTEFAILDNYRKAGTTGGRGVLEGIPHIIKVVENGQEVVFFDGYIDLRTAQWGKDQVQADSISRIQLDWLNEVADGFSFQYLKEGAGELTDDDQVYVPYVISSIPDYLEAFMIILTLTFVILELKRLITDIVNKITESAGYLSSVSGIINLIFKIIWGLIMLVTIIELILNMVDLLIQKVKYKPAMNVNRQIEAACNHLGLLYQSSILQTPEWEKAYIIPESLSNPATQSDSRIKGFFKGDDTQQNGYFRGTFGDLLRAMKDAVNGRIVLTDDTLKIEPRLRTANSSTFRLPSQWRPKFEFTLNADSFVSNYTIDFRYDTTDGNTIDNWTGNNMQSQLQPKTKNSRQLTLMSGLRRVQLPFARGIKKTELTPVEKIVDTLLEGLDPVIGSVITIANGAIAVLNQIFDIINKITRALATIGLRINLNLPQYAPLEDPNLGDLLDNRIGMLKLDNDDFAIAKLVMLDVGETDDKTKLAPENETIIRAKYLYENYHITNSFAPEQDGAQRIIYRYENVELNLADYLKIEAQAVVKMPDNQVAEVLSCRWNPSNRLATIDVAVRKLWTTNIEETIFEPIGR